MAKKKTESKETSTVENTEEVVRKPLLNRRFLLTVITLVILGAIAIGAAYIGKGYRVSPTTGTVFGTGIISVTSIPDQASVYLDNHLITATNANINSLEPTTYNLKIHKDGYIDWERKVDVKQGLVTEIKAVLFPALPSVYPLSFNGAIQPVLSPDGQKVAYIVPAAGKKGGVWVWTMSPGQIGFSRGGEPHQVMPNIDDVDLTKAKMRWSPDSQQVLVDVSERHFLLDQDRSNDPPRDITPILQPTLRGWEEDQKQLNAVKVAAIKDLQIRKTASESAYLKWSPDETKFIYSKNGVDDFKSVDLKLGQVYSLPKSKFYSWLPNSLHLVTVDEFNQSNQPVASPSADQSNFGVGKISVMEYQGTNKAEIFAGNFDLTSVFAWPDSSRLVMLYSLPTTTASQPNLYGINLK